MKEKSLNQIQHLSALINKFMRIANALCFIISFAVFVMIIFHVIGIITDKYWIISSVITFNGVTFPVETDLVIAEKLAPAVILIDIFLLISILLLCRIIYLIRNILNCVEEKNPFDGTVSKTLIKLGKIILVCGTLLPFIELTIEKVLFAAYMPFIQTLSQSATGFNILSQGLTFDFSVLLLAGFIILLGYIFSYGELLQIESDETL